MGRVGESERVSAELDAYGVGWPWFTLGDLDLGTHLARLAHLRAGLTLTEATARLCERWRPGVTLLPMSDDEVETWVVVGDDSGGERSMHFEEWWVRHRAALPARRFEQRGVADARPTSAVLDAIARADAVILAPSNPVVSIGTILGVPGVREAVQSTPAPVVGVSPIIGGTAVRGMADACLEAIGVATEADAVARHYGARRTGGLLDGWLVDTADASSIGRLETDGIRSVARPLMMSDLPRSSAIAAAAVQLASRVDPRG